MQKGKLLPREGSHWWRFAEYEIDNGLIRVVPGAPGVRYEPLATPPDDEPWGRSKRGSRVSLAYRALIAVVTDPAVKMGGEMDRPIWKAVSCSNPSRELRARILSFTRDFGLLGIFHRRVREIMFPGPVIAEYSLGWVRTASSWQKHATSPPVSSMCTLDALPLELGGLESIPFDVLNREYFGERLSPEFVPSPVSEEFNALYREPVEQWLAAAVDFASAVMEQRHDHINAILSVAPPEYLIGMDGVTFRYRYGSLLEALAAQFIRDRRSGQMLDFCQNRTCGQMYFHSDPRARFCSVKCSNAERQRQYREVEQQKKLAARRRRNG